MHDIQIVKPILTGYELGATAARLVLERIRGKMGRARDSSTTSLRFAIPRLHWRAATGRSAEGREKRPQDVPPEGCSDSINSMPSTLHLTN